MERHVILRRNKLYDDYMDLYVDTLFYGIHIEKERSTVVEVGWQHWSSAYSWGHVSLFGSNDVVQV